MTLRSGCLQSLSLGLEESVDCDDDADDPDDPGPAEIEEDSDNDELSDSGDESPGGGGDADSSDGDDVLHTTLRRTLEELDLEELPNAFYKIRSTDDLVGQIKIFASRDPIISGQCSKHHGCDLVMNARVHYLEKMVSVMRWLTDAPTSTPAEHNASCRKCKTSFGIVPRS